MSVNMARSTYIKKITWIRATFQPALDKLGDESTTSSPSPSRWWAGPSGASLVFSMSF